MDVWKAFVSKVDSCGSVVNRLVVILFGVKMLEVGS